MCHSFSMTPTCILLFKIYEGLPPLRVVIDPGSDRSVNESINNWSMVNVIDRPVSGKPCESAILGLATSDFEFTIVISVGSLGINL
jgi:hypothetical protein